MSTGSSVGPGAGALLPDDLRRDRIAHVVARVVLAERPTSAKPGDTAIVLPDGTMYGFVGGTCSESTVRAQALALLDSGETRLLRISPTPEPAQSGKLCIHNPCLSGGTLEIFLEPVLPSPLVLVAGDTPIARALASLGAALGYEVRPFEGLIPSDTAAVVVASHGRDEEDTLRAALATSTRYVGLVASRTRGEAVLASLGMCSSHTSRVRTPAGVDIGARTPQEVALSILAEIVASRRSITGRAVNANTDVSLDVAESESVGSVESADTVDTVDAAVMQTRIAKDPVCAMDVVMVDASLHFDHGPRRYWFCGSGCLRAFAADPSAYAADLSDTP